MSANFAYLNTRELKFILQEWLPTEEIFAYPKFADYYSKEDVASVLDPCMKIAKEQLEPSNEEGNAVGCKFENGSVTTPPSFGPLFHMLQGEGWGTANFNEAEDAMVLPKILFLAVWEMFGAANPSLYPYILLTSGAFGLIQSFGSEYVKGLFEEKMMDGTWAGAMCLTEPTAGSDVGDILSKATPTDDPRIFNIKGNKIFITGGDNDFTENIIHLYLARVEGARPGTGGISLFAVPKLWVNEDGSLEDNDVETTGIEHKLGQYGSITASLAFGENGKCRGWLLGKNPLDNDGKGEGMSQMFQMMNEERLYTAQLGYALTANAFYNAREYCKERIQGRPFTNPRGERQTLIHHEDIKRTLLMGKAIVEAQRAMMFKCFCSVDVSQNDPDPEKRALAIDIIEVLTPLCKAYNTDETWVLMGEAIQAYGGYGYCEEYPVAQLARDCKIYSIWEGTNYIQSVDLIGRKWGLKKGQAFGNFLKDIKDFIDANENTEGLEKEFVNLKRAYDCYANIQKTVAGWMQTNPALMPVYSRRILTATAQLYAGRCILDQAVIACARAKEVGPDHYDYNFYIGKVMSAKYYLRNVVPNVWALEELISDADDSVLQIPVESFDY
ncbi:MAG: acyl-CoA dehydrogenase [Syntrophomonadaceae bacterium]|nr:acyl-CoA dehydrogenase [Syntrophomonadaceae bacterium]